MEESPLVSVIMPAYNSAKFIAESIQSVLHQFHSNWELLIIDDASEDNTVEIIEKFASSDPRIQLFQNKTNKGTGISRNIGIKAAQGSYIAFLDADDLWLPKKLEAQLDFMKRRDLEMTYSSYYLINESGQELHKKIQALPILSYKKLLKSNYVGNLTGIYKVEKLGKIYSPILRKRQDWALWLAILKRIESTKGIIEPLAKYRIRENSISNNKTALLKYNYLIYREFLKYSKLKSLVKMGVFLKEHFFIKKKQVVSK
ncbi:glycosyltransferase family 2 protein [Gillisia hiemivivida]|uniref:Glycosyltransferase family 2 protein n=1 Tax=Gillisia hiemivivida TaxID=291190 RepID=A0A5C6ZX19_9FLAO|nr:glycosyltransferase family 2 protein [Gillisia hiemivivida]TXD95553.1 glycosyltransferase family 2 protein [Gillisia hiemivivida]